MEDLAHSPPDNTELRDDLREGFLQGSSEAVRAQDPVA